MLCVQIFLNLLHMENGIEEAICNNRNGCRKFEAHKTEKLIKISNYFSFLRDLKNSFRNDNYLNKIDLKFVPF